MRKSAEGATQARAALRAGKRSAPGSDTAAAASSRRPDWFSEKHGPGVQQAWRLFDTLASLGVHTLPARIQILHSDKSLESIHDTVAKLLERPRLEFAQSCPRRRNDNAVVETKNGALVRKQIPTSGCRRARATTLIGSVSRGSIHTGTITGRTGRAACAREKGASSTRPACARAQPRPRGVRSREESVFELGYSCARSQPRPCGVRSREESVFDPASVRSLPTPTVRRALASVENVPSPCLQTKT